YTYYKAFGLIQHFFGWLLHTKPLKLLEFFRNMPSAVQVSLLTQERPHPEFDGQRQVLSRNPIQKIRVIDSHTGGEPTRLVIAGGPDLGSGALAERLTNFRSQHDW